MTKSKVITFLYGNECANPPLAQDYVEDDFITIKREWPDFITLNEIWIGRYKDAVRRIFDKRHGWEIDHLSNSANPIITRSAVGKVRDHVYRIVAHKGYAAVTPSRTITGIKVKVHGLDKSIIITNRHYVSGAWNKKWKFRKKLRQRLWCKMYDTDRHFVETMTSRGYIVVSFGDWNKIDIEPFNNRSFWLDDNGIVKAQISLPRDSNLTYEVVKKKAIGNVHTDKNYNVLKLRFSAVGNA